MLLLLRSGSKPIHVWCYSINDAALTEKVELLLWKPFLDASGGGRSLPETGLAALSRPIAIAAHGMWPISTSMARVDRRARKKKTSPSDPDAVGLGFQ